MDSLARNRVLNDNSALLYFDLATWKNNYGETPIFSFDRKIRQLQKEEFSSKSGFENLIAGYDFAIDIDSADLVNAWKEALVIHKILESYYLPYSVRFSGRKGFHFVIDQKWIKLSIKPLEWASYFGRVVANLVEREGLKNVDLVIYDPRRILKLAYSLVNSDDKESVALPLDNSQLTNFKREYMQLDYVASYIPLFKRGLLERHLNLPQNQLILNVQRFLKDYD